MRLDVVRLIVVFVIVSLGPSSVFAQEDEKSTRVWVTIENSQFIPELNEGAWERGDDLLRNVFENFDVKSCEQALPDSRKEALLNVYEVEARGGSYESFSQALEEIAYCSQADPAPEYELLSVDPFPDDYNLTFAEDYALDLINAEKAWEYSTGDPNTIIGIVDGGYYLNHNELQGKYVSALNPSFASPTFYMHGTAVSIAAAGNTNNGIGKSAIGYNCGMALNTLGYNQMLQLCYQGARVINVSWSSGCTYTGYYDLIMGELFENGCIVVAAAGNGSSCGGPTGLVYPAAVDGVISVTSVGPWDNHESIPGNPNTTHQHNAQVDICAPGYNIAGTNYPGNYLTGSGTSFAAPYVSGTIGLMLSLRPCLTREEVIDILSITAKDIYPLNAADYDGLLGAGRLDAGAALEYVNSYNCDAPPTTVGGTVGVLTPNNPPRPMGSSTPMPNNLSQTQQIANLEEEVFEAADVRVFPNPNRGSFKVSWEGVGPDQIIVTDGAGRVVSSPSVHQGKNLSEIDLHQTGVYFVQLIQEGTVVANRKVLVY